MEKPLRWIGSAYRELIAFPPAARREAGFSLGLVQEGDQPADWKPMESIGPGACELRLRTVGPGTVQYRVVYVVKFPEAVYVLHAFEKKSQKTPGHHLDLARARYRVMLRNR
jgi:phage-related protein